MTARLASTNRPRSSPIRPARRRGAARPRAWTRPRLELLETRQLLALVINPTFASNITSDPNAAAIMATINRTIAAYENLITDNVTVDITFQEGGGLGGSSGGLGYFIKYSDYRAALVSHATSSNDNTAIASLPSQANDPINNNATIFVRSPLARALGFNAPSAGGTAGDGTITLNTAICNLDRTGTQDPSKYDLQGVVAHEIDEILGFGSALEGANNGDPAPTGRIAPDDLFRYDQNGARSFTTSATAQAYFSIDGGSTDLARFNQAHNPSGASGDYGDWYSTGPHTYQIQDAFGTPGATANLNVELTRLDVLGYTLALHAPQVTAASDQTAVEGASNSFDLGNFTDPDAAPWGVTVSWGDGSPNTTYSLNNAGALGSKPHTYNEEGAYTVTVTVNDFTSQTQTKTFKVNVSDPAVIGAGASIAPVEGAGATWTVATFTDPGGNEPVGSYSADINWGDGTGTQVGAGTISFNGSYYLVKAAHTYAEESAADHPGSQPYQITVTIHHESAPTTTVLSTATVSDPSVVGTAAPVFAVDCKTVTVTTATFTDPGGPEKLADYSAAIDWGDGSSPSAGVISLAGGVFTVVGSHAYASPGNYTIKTTIQHEASTPTVVASPAVVKDDLGLLVLDPRGSGALTVSGNGQVVATGCGAVVVDSNASNGAVVADNGVLTASQIHVAGGLSAGANTVVSPPAQHYAPIADPLGLAAPTPQAPYHSAVYASMVPISLSPGTYFGGIHISGNVAATLAPGVYYMAGGGFSVTGNGKVDGAGVVIVNLPSGPWDAVEFGGNARVTLSAPSSGPLQGIVILQDPSSGVPIKAYGDARANLAGVVYAPGAAVDVGGNAVVTVNPGPGTATLPPIYGAIIAYDLLCEANGKVVINPDPVVTPMFATLSESTPADLNDAAIDALVDVGGGGGGGSNGQTAPALGVVGGDWFTSLSSRKKFWF